MTGRQRFYPYINFEKADDQGGQPADDPGDQSDGKKAPKDIMPDADPGGLRQEIRSLRNENATYRERSKDYEDTKARLENLENGLKGMFGEGEELDPEKLKSKTENLESQLQTERTKNAVTIQAISAGLDPDLTIAYLQNKGKLSDVDLDKSGDIETLITKVAEDKPALKVNKAEAVGTGGNGKDGGNEKPLNPIEAFQEARGIFSRNK